MAVSLVGSVGTGTAVTGASSVSGTYGQSPTSGNLLVAVVFGALSVAGAWSTGSSSSGWAQLMPDLADQAAGTGDSYGGIGIWYKTAAGGDSAPEFTLSGGAEIGWGQVFILELSGARTGNPLDTYATYCPVAANQAYDAGTDGPFTTAGNIAGPGEYAIAAAMVAYGTGVHTAPADFTNLKTTADGTTFFMAIDAYAGPPSQAALSGTDAFASADTWVLQVPVIAAQGTPYMTNIVIGNVVDDYGLDNVPYTVGTTGSSTALLAYISWSVAQLPSESTGFAPAVNVTDSAGNLWRQLGISTASTAVRGAIWMADNPRQTEWVSVALTGWANSTSYIIMEMDGVPSSMTAVSLDFVQTVTHTVSGTGLILNNATASTTDTVFGLVSTGGDGGAMAVADGWTGIATAGGLSSTDATTYALWIATQDEGTVPEFYETWANTVPSTGIIVGLKQSSAAPSQPNPNMPAIVVEAAFGATPGDFTQSVDYTWSVEGITWTDISSRCFSKGDEQSITVKRGRQYELTQEETGEIDILIDNHDGALTFGNTASPYYPHVIPGVPIRITAWFNGTQYPVAFGYVERWPQEWPDMPQWGFSTLVAVDAYGPMASTNLPSAVQGDIRKDNPYCYFPTNEQYEFTSQSLTPTAVPLDANGLTAINMAFGNERYGAYRDGYDQPVTVGQALNLLGDEDTSLGATTYTAQENNDNGPGLFYFDPNIPGNYGNGSFSVEFWFAWGNTSAYACTLFSAFATPTSFFAAQTLPTNGGVLTVGINTNPNNTTTVQTGFFVNNVAIDGGTFNQDTFAPQHFALTTGPGGTACYLNGVLQGTAPELGVIGQVRAITLGPAQFSYDCSGMVVYDGYNYIAGHLAWYPYEMQALQIENHYASGIDGFVGTPAPGRFAQVLTWGLLGLKRGGTAWYRIYGSAEDTYMSEAYSYEGSSASDVMGQIVQTEGGRCFTQANGSVIYQYRWYVYNQSAQFTFGDDPSLGEIPFAQETSFAVDNQYIYNLVTATQNRGPDTEFYVWNTNSLSQEEYFMRSGLDIQSYAMMPFDVYDVTNWNSVKYSQPVQRAVSVEIDASKIQASNSQAFPAVLSLELNDFVTVNRRPIGGATISVTGAIQEISHEIGATYWHTSYQVAPIFPESNALMTDQSPNNSPGTSYLSW